MPVADLNHRERLLALDAIEWAAGPGGAAIDVDRALAVRKAVRRDDWDRAWRSAAELVVEANRRRAGRRRATSPEAGQGDTPVDLGVEGWPEVVGFAQRALEATRVDPRPDPGPLFTDEEVAKAAPGRPAWHYDRRRRLKTRRGG